MSFLSELRSHRASKAVGDLTEKLVKLVFEKVAGHLQNPQQYPMPADDQSAERLILNFISALPERRQRKFREKNDDLLAKTAAQRKAVYGNLSEVNLHAAIPVAEQVKNLYAGVAPALSASDTAEIKSLLKKQAAVKKTVRKNINTPVLPAQASVPPTVNFFVDSLTCNKNSEIGKDEISLGAIAVDPLGVTQNKNPFFVGKFKKGQTITIPAADSLLFNLGFNNGSVTEFPQTFSAALFLLEEDIMHNLELANKLSIACFAIWGLGILAVAVLIGVGVAGGPVTPVIAMLVLLGAQIFLVIGLQLIPLIADDFSNTVPDFFIVEEEPVANSSTSRTIELQLRNTVSDLTPGLYTANVRWEVVVS